MFYRFGDQDFTSVIARDLRPGDKIAHGYGGGHVLYGAIRIECVTQFPTLVIIEHLLPVGASVISQRDVELSIEWQGTTPLIKVVVYFDPGQRVLVR